MISEEVEEESSLDPSAMALVDKVRRMQISDIGTVKEGGDPRIVQILEDYFGQFCAPVRETTVVNGEEKTREYCPGCGEMFTGLMASLGMGAGIEWGLAHGEGHCSKCRYPYRGHHFVYDPEDPKPEPFSGERREPLLTIHNLFLAYHPSNVSPRWKRPKPEENY